MSQRISRAIIILTWADILIFSGFGLIMPLFAVFITGNIQGAGVTTVGFYTAIYWLAKSFFQIPVAWYLDKIEGEYDEFYAMVTGYFIWSATAIGYIFASQVGHIYLLAIAAGLADALGVPSYLSIFSRHLDRAKENIEWTLHSVGVGLSSAGAGALAGIMVEKFGFNSVFILGGVLGIASALSLFILRPYLKATDGRSMIYHIPTSSPPDKKPL